MPVSEGSPLDYQRRSRFSRRKRWILVGVIIVLSAVGMYWRNAVYDFASSYWELFQRDLVVWRCLKFEAPGDRLVYSDDPIDMHPLDGGPGVYATGDQVMNWHGWGETTIHRQGVGWMPNVLRGVFPGAQNLFTLPVWQNVEPPRYVESAAFVHELKSPSGHRRLVVIGAYGGSDFKPSVWDPGDIWNPDSCIVSDGSYGNEQIGILHLQRGPLEDNSVRIFAGAADPGDRSRFTIGGQYNGRPFVIHGQLKDDESIDWTLDTGWLRRREAGETYWILGSGDSSLIDSAAKPQSVEVKLGNYAWGTPKFVAFCEHNTKVNVVFDDSIICVERATGNIVWRRELGHGLIPKFISADGRALLLENLNWLGAVTGWRVIDVATGDTLMEPVAPFVKADDVAFSISPQGAVLAAAYEAGRRTLLRRWELPSRKALPDINVPWTAVALAVWDDGRVWIARDAVDISQQPTWLSAKVSSFARDGTAGDGVIPIHYYFGTDGSSDLSYFQLGRGGSSVLASWTRGYSGFQILESSSGKDEFIGNEGTYENTDSGGFFAIGDRVLAHVAYTLNDRIQPTPDPVSTTELFLQDMPGGKRIYRFQIGAAPGAMAISEGDEWVVTCGEKAELCFWSVPGDLRGVGLSPRQ